MPRFELAAVHEAAAGGRVEGGSSRYRDRLLPLLGTYSAMHEFACGVLLELRPEDYLKPERYDDVEMDSYGIAISERLQERFGLEGFVTWYVKFTMDVDEEGCPVVMASLHGAEVPLRRAGGTIAVQFARRTP